MKKTKITSAITLFDCCAADNAATGDVTIAEVEISV